MQISNRLVIGQILQGQKLQMVIIMCLVIVTYIQSLEELDIFFEDCRNVALLNCTCNINEQHILARSSSGIGFEVDTCKEINVRNCTVSNCDHGFCFSDSQAKLESCVFYQVKRKQIVVNDSYDFQSSILVNGQLLEIDQNTDETEELSQEYD
eukprot:TRINITY_DN23778_c0_g1_i2.p2 TRINITY_DN23778_c0_g1~~TRINITY_DN23778_c0_g1_i2.p2  ORF type:complete len:153 (-),score=0.82 TRINITY_DN23778_c0_g1_i2:150-608(-)